MSDTTAHIRKQSELRVKAVSRLKGTHETTVTPSSAPAAYDVLHKLATSPATAVDALALLHELQVHQVELELQAEQMWESYAHLEAALQRQRQLYESAPIGYFTVDRDTSLIELNAAGSQLLGSTREALFERRLDSFLLPDSARKMQALLRDVAAGQQVGTCDLQLTTRDGEAKTVHACVNADPDGNHFLVAFMLASARRPEHREPSSP